ncbi:hypothetical protein [Pseudoalteromonas sp. S558]|uniref:hypothetical protein n=1 Tax=Pseudoalteromonas sp. S558 TaxID=2066515 RepID=UPI00110B4646|nr:hypothetical protein [Pseudoalteromonas sp. S558]TMN94211.1 hypothetical protein CWB66_20360 [Pseudoalteromonas sp. S558]
MGKIKFLDMPEYEGKQLNCASLCATNDGYIALTGKHVKSQGASQWFYSLLCMDLEFCFQKFIDVGEIVDSGSQWLEAGLELLTGNSQDVFGIINQGGRGLWVDITAGTVVASNLKPLDMERIQPSLLSTFPGGRRSLGVMPRLEQLSYHIVNYHLVISEQEAFPPSQWNTMKCESFDWGIGDGTESDFGSVDCSEIGKSRIFNPRVVQILALGCDRWLLSIVTSGNSKAAYPNKGMGYRYSIIDSTGAEIAVLDHKEASEKLPVNVYEKADYTHFPNAEYPFYKVYHDIKYSRIIHKLLNQIIFFDLNGRLMGVINFANKGLTGMRRLKLLAVSPTGEMIFRREQEKLMWSVELSDCLKETEANLIAGLKEYRKKVKDMSNSSLNVPSLGEVNHLSIT